MIAECSEYGQPQFENNEYCPHCNQTNPKSKVGTFAFVPWWGWVFVIACGAIPVATVGGALPTGLGFGTAAACAGIAKRPDWSVAARVVACAGVSIGAWILLAAFVLGVARLGV